ncbi:MAG: L,D-transpeptidase [Actinomycetota bacterium]|nr:L,D-transpeptidase [Actinomycetota bacterium]
MPRTDNTRPRHHVKAALVAVACLAGLFAAMQPATSPAGVTASAKVAPAKYPKAGVILWRKLAAHSSPRESSPTIKTFSQFRTDFRPTTLLALGMKKDAKGVSWLKLSIPMRPNGRTGWVKAAAVQMRPVRRAIVIDLSSRKLRVLEGDKTRFATRVAIGRPGMETPTGNFYLMATFKPKERFLGAFAFETSAYSKLSEWPGGGIVGLHGTSMPWLLGQAVSHGCVRMSNAAAQMLKRLTPAGTPLKIVA